jgi:F-type H+-transporting ATPase subunit a
MQFKPLDQFITNIIISYPTLSDLYVVIGDTEYIYIILVILIIAIGVTFNSLTKIKGYPQKMVKKLYIFIKNMILDQINRFGEYYFIFINTLFINILLLNFTGLIPGSVCATAQLSIALTFSFAVFGGVIIFVCHWLGVKVLISLFIPKNVPQAMLPLLIVIEAVSFLSRAISLAVRLFANMVAGHSLLYILLNAITSGINVIAKEDIMATLIFIIPVGIIFSIYLLETGIAFLQAYVFAVLSLIYLKDSIHGSH